MKAIKKIQQAYQNKIPKWIRNKYVVSSLILIFYIFLFDQNNLISVFQWRMELKDLRKEQAYYREHIHTVKQNLKELSGNQKMLEKFAREKYFMKKDNEDIYLIVKGSVN